jgi:hypothetical protein
LVGHGFHSQLLLLLVSLSDIVIVPQFINMQVQLPKDWLLFHHKLHLLSDHFLLLLFCLSSLLLHALHFDLIVPFHFIFCIATLQIHLNHQGACMHLGRLSNLLRTFSSLKYHRFGLRQSLSEINACLQFEIVSHNQLIHVQYSSNVVSLNGEGHLGHDVLGERLFVDSEIVE